MNILQNAKRIVLKIGSSTLTHETGKLNLRRMELLAQVLSDLQNAGKQIVLVSSGAVSCGRSRMGLHHRPASIEEKQAMAAVGQSELMKTYDHFFSAFGHTVAQVLITRYTIESPASRTNAENTLHILMQMGCVPIVNENDTVSFDEIEFGDNDTLSAYVAVLCHADALINLSDIDGFYDSDPHANPDAKLIPTVEKIDESVYACAGGAGTDRGTGGVITKLRAAEISTSHGIPMFLCNGENPEIIYDLMQDKPIGTRFLP